MWFVLLTRALLFTMECRSNEKPSLLAGANEKGEMYRERFKLVKQRLLRNENFCPPTMQMSDDDNFEKVTTRRK